MDARRTHAEGPARTGEQDVRRVRARGALCALLTQRCPAVQSAKKVGLKGGTGHVAARNEKEAAEQEGSAQQYGKAGPTKS